MPMPLLSATQITGKSVIGLNRRKYEDLENIEEMGDEMSPDMAGMDDMGMEEPGMDDTGMDDMGDVEDFSIADLAMPQEFESAKIPDRGNKMPINYDKLAERVKQDILREAGLDVRTTVNMSSGGDSGDVTMGGSGNLNTRDVANSNKVTQPPGDAGSQKKMSTPQDRGPEFTGIPGVDKAKAGASGRADLDSNGGNLGSVRENIPMHEAQGVANSTAFAPGDYIAVYNKGDMQRVDRGIVQRVTKTSVTLEGNVDYNSSSYDFRQLA